MINDQENYYKLESVENFHASKNFINANLVMTAPDGKKYIVPVSYFASDLKRWSDSRKMSIDKFINEVGKIISESKYYWRRPDHDDPRWLGWFESDITIGNLAKEIIGPTWT